MPIGECMRAHTHRQFLSWMYWLRDEWNNPSKSDLYLMQVACEVRRVLAKDPNRVRLNDFKLSFEFKTDAPAPAAPPDAEEISRRSQSMWFAAVGLKAPPGAAAKDE